MPRISFGGYYLKCASIILGSGSVKWNALKSLESKWKNHYCQIVQANLAENLKTLEIGKQTKAGTREGFPKKRVELMTSFSMYHNLPEMPR